PRCALRGVARRHADLLEGVHPGDRDDDWNAPARVPGLQVEPRRQRRATGEWDPRRLDAMVGELRVLRVALALLAVVEPVQLVVLVDRPLRGGPVDGGHE